MTSRTGGTLHLLVNSGTTRDGDWQAYPRPEWDATPPPPTTASEGILFSWCGTCGRRPTCDRTSPILISVGKAFTIALRGYDMGQVDRLLDRAELALASEDQRLRHSVLDELRSATFPQRLRGYDRMQVERFVDDLVRELS